MKMGKENRTDILQKNGITKEQIIADSVINSGNYTEKEQQKCEYCHDKNGKPFTKEKLISTMYGSYKDHSEYVKRVRYCEICGRQLISK